VIASLARAWRGDHLSLSGKRDGPEEPIVRFSAGLQPVQAL